MPWYTLQTNPNYEAKVITALEAKQKDENLAVQEIFSPMEVIREVKDGKVKEKSRRVYTNYIFIKMDFSDEIWHSIRKIKGVVKFIGNGVRPSMMSDREIDEMKKKVENGTLQARVQFKVNDNVRIKDGSFTGFIGIIQKVEAEKNKAVVILTIFNRETPTEIELKDLEVVE